MQSTFGGFGLINQENVFKVCDQPHPLLVGSIIADCLKLKIDDAYDGMRVTTSRLLSSKIHPPCNHITAKGIVGCCFWACIPHCMCTPYVSSLRHPCDSSSAQALCDLGYSSMDIITTVFRVVRNYDMQEFLKLEFIKVGLSFPQ